METKTNMVRFCPFCGKKIEYQHIQDDGLDWEGHSRGSYRCYDTEKRCKCEQGNFKKMCLNCEYNNDGSCICDNVIEKLKESINNDSPFFVKEISTEIKDVTKKCSYWKLNGRLIEKYFE
jgi:hypothetical protein